ncbi:YciI family protein [Piscinibacter sp. HJYY11]|uniref:YciI family protein n=1 Tax=Piscinibacter sp. HJYY11 TaxID=2801333 RepID=UPI00191DE9F0|nr:YciI family protein [Piscinibacter sp. HJYY11]MBL0727977.1 YciI family protein [Piscinibacter sp. HJYY11]
MRFMILIKATPASEAGVVPDDALMAALADFHEQLAREGVLLDSNPLHPSAMGWRVHHDRQGGRRIVDGPFAETKELISGYTLIQVRSREEALEWSRRFPALSPGHDCHIELRQVFELGDFAGGEAVDRFKALEAATLTRGAAA